jgi:short-subunit dehydrogenase
VNNAGYGSYGALEDVPLEEARRQFEVNLFGLAALTQRVIPHMREQRWGRIVNVSSIGGVGATPYGGWYHATKFALEGYSAALRQELEPFGVHVVVIRPGAIMTEWGGIATDSLLAVSGKGPYAKAVQAMAALFKKLAMNPKMAAPPSVIGDMIRDASTVRKPRAIYIAPFSARIFPFMHWLLSHRGFDAVVRAGMRLPKRMG